MHSRLRRGRLARVGSRADHRSTICFPVTIHSDSSAAIFRACASIATRRRAAAGCCGSSLVVLLAAVAAVYPTRPRLPRERRAPEVDVARATQVVDDAGRLDRPAGARRDRLRRRAAQQRRRREDRRSARAAQVRGRDARPQGRGHRRDRARRHRRAARGVAPPGRGGRGAAGAGRSRRATKTCAPSIGSARWRRTASPPTRR